MHHFFIDTNIDGSVSTGNGNATNTAGGGGGQQIGAWRRLSGFVRARPSASSEDVDLRRGVLMVRRSRRRPRYVHGCGDTCGRKAGYCPQRERTHPETADTKSRAGRRAVGLPAQLVDLLKTHNVKQDAERDAAGADWTDEGRLFATPVGRGTPPRTDYDDWKELLRDAKVRDGRLSDVRRTAATALLILGVSERAVMALMGWSTTAMAARYQHMVDSVRSDVARQLDGLIWEPNGGPEDDGAAGVLVPAD
jgi:integrase